MIKLLFDMDFCCARWMFDMDFSWDTALQQKSDVKNSPKTQPCNNKSSSKTQPCNNKSRMKQQKFIPPQTQRENIMICTPHLVNSWAPVWALFLPCLILWFYMLFCILSFYLRFFFDFYVIKTLCNQKLFVWFLCDSFVWFLLLVFFICIFCFLPIFVTGFSFCHMNLEKAGFNWRPRGHLASVCFIWYIISSNGENVQNRSKQPVKMNTLWYLRGPLRKGSWRSFFIKWPVWAFTCFHQKTPCFYE